jgi:hypothetical protein
MIWPLRWNSMYWMKFRFKWNWFNGWRKTILDHFMTHLNWIGPYGSTSSNGCNWKHRWYCANVWSYTWNWHIVDNNDMEETWKCGYYWSWMKFNHMDDGHDHLYYQFSTIWSTIFVSLSFIHVLSSSSVCSFSSKCKIFHIVQFHPHR